MEKTIDKLLLDGGCTCFDFTNTVNSRHVSSGHEYLKTYADLLEWCNRTGLISSARIKELFDLANSRQKEAEQIMEGAMMGREVLFRVFSAVAAGQKPDRKDLAAFNEKVSDSLSHVRLTMKNGEKSLDLSPDKPDLEEPLWQIYKSAFDVWINEDVDRIKECESCGWLFLDKSKNNRRRWCNMKTCGSSDKALRYYYKKKKEGENA